MLSVACMFPTWMVILIVCLTHMSDCNYYVDLLNQRCAVMSGNHTVPSKQASSWLYMSGCEWLLCCSLRPSGHMSFYLPTTIHVLVWTCRAQSLSRWTDQVGTAGWHHLALILLPRYQAGLEQILSRKTWRGCSIENRRWSLTAKRQLPGECCYGGSWSSALK